MRCKNKVAIITGAASGIGLAISKKLIDEGAKVILNDSDELRLLQEVEALGKNAVASPGDCSDLDIIDQLIDAAITHFGQIDIAFANAGITSFGDFLSYQPEVFDQLMKVNLGGSFFLAQRCARQMIRQRSGGKIIFMSSVTGHTAHKNLAAYGMSKAALELLTKHLVAELSEHHISINSIAPGATLTERTLQDTDYEKTWSRITPSGRPASVEDIANIALFLASDESNHITGQTIVVDGGWTSTSPSPY